MSTLDINTGQIAANANETDRSAFIRRTYTHVAGAILALAVLLFAAVTSGIAEQFYSLLGVSRYSWLIVLGLFMGVSSIASKWAHSDVSRSTQYLSLIHI